MFVELAQTGENQFISCELMKWGEGAVFCVLYGANTPFRKKIQKSKNSKNQVFFIYVRVRVIWKNWVYFRMYDAIDVVKFLFVIFVFVFLVDFCLLCTFATQNKRISCYAFGVRGKSH